MRFLPASRISGADLKQCLISDGCIIHPGVTIERAVVGVRSVIGKGVTLRDTILIGADRYETDSERELNRQLGRPDLGIGEGSVLENAMIDKDCRIGRNVRIVNHKGIQDLDTPLYSIREGIVAVPRGITIPDGTVI